MVTHQCQASLVVCEYWGDCVFSMSAFSFKLECSHCHVVERRLTHHDFLLLMWEYSFLLLPSSVIYVFVVCCPMFLWMRCIASNHDSSWTALLSCRYVFFVYCAAWCSIAPWLTIYGRCILGWYMFLDDTGAFWFDLSCFGMGSSWCCCCKSSETSEVM